MIKIKLTCDDLAGIRIASSPLLETITSLRALRSPERHAANAPWLRQARSRLSGTDTALLRAVVPDPGYVPDFLTPLPAGIAGDLGSELSVLCATPPEQVRSELMLAFRGMRLPARLQFLWDAPADGVKIIADQLNHYFDLVLAEHWDGLRSLHDAEVMRHARRLASSGAHQLLSELHPGICWSGDWMRINNIRERPLTVELHLTGLLVLPSVFSWPGPLVTVQPAWPATVVYSPRGIGALWGESPRQRRAALAALIGSTRAALLELLDRPMSTSELAARLKISAGCASHHLSVLRNAGMVGARRQGRWVLYERTAAGETLITSGG